MTKEELRTLAELGALNRFAEHRREAMWRVEETVHADLLRSHAAVLFPALAKSPAERHRRGAERARELSALADDNAGASAGRLRDDESNDRSASDEVAARSSCRTPGARSISPRRATAPRCRSPGNVICRQRPGTAKGFVFISLEDETGVSNAIVTPDLFEKLRLLITEEPFLVIEGTVQNSDDVVLIKAKEIRPLAHEQLVGANRTIFISTRTTAFRAAPDVGDDTEPLQFRAAHVVQPQPSRTNRRTDRWPRRAAGHKHAVTAGDHTSDGFAGFRISAQRFVLHALLHLETPDRFVGVGRFVNVNWHGDLYSAARCCSLVAAGFSVGVVSDSSHSV